MHCFHRPLLAVIEIGWPEAVWGTETDHLYDPIEHKLLNFNVLPTDTP